MVDDQTRERWIATEANALWSRLQFFAAKDRIFILSEVMTRVTKKLKSRESTRMYVPDPMFPPEDPPTDPQFDPPGKLPDLGEDETRCINVDELMRLKNKSRK